MFQIIYLDSPPPRLTLSTTTEADSLFFRRSSRLGGRTTASVRMTSPLLLFSRSEQHKDSSTKAVDNRRYVEDFLPLSSSWLQVEQVR